MKAPAERGVGRGKEREGRGAQGGKGSAESEKRDDCQESVRAHPAEKRCVITLKTVPTMRVRSEHNSPLGGYTYLFSYLCKSSVLDPLFLKVRWMVTRYDAGKVRSKCADITLYVSFVCITQTRS